MDTLPAAYFGCMAELVIRIPAQMLLFPAVMVDIAPGLGLLNLEI